MEIIAQSLDHAVIGLSRALMKEGVDVTRRGFKCREIPEAVMVRIDDPCNRYVTIPQRKWNKTLGWIESLWLARGDNSMEMPKAYVKNLMTFSDDGMFMRAGYGPRIRRFGSNVYDMVTTEGETLPCQYAYLQEGVDQLRFVVEKFAQDIDTREAVITIHDPIADDFNRNTNRILNTKDTPCTRSIHFMIVNGRMNCYVHIRSNDIVWGFSAVNVFNFTLMQEYVAMMAGVPVGQYFHYADNLHVYEDFIPLVKEMAMENVYDYPSQHFYYNQDIHDLTEFDKEIRTLSNFESLLRHGELSIVAQKSDLFKDWATVIERKWNKNCDRKFINPMLNRLYGLE